MLIGGDSSNCGDRCMRVTIHHCFFDGTRQRHPRVRFAKVHLYNNYTRNWGIYAVCASVESQVGLLLATFSSPSPLIFLKGGEIGLCKFIIFVHDVIVDNLNLSRVRYIRSATYMKLDKKRWPSNISRRR